MTDIRTTAAIAALSLAGALASRAPRRQTATTTVAIGTEAA